VEVAIAPVECEMSPLCRLAWLSKTAPNLAAMRLGGQAGDETARYRDIGLLCRHRQAHALSGPSGRNALYEMLGVDKVVKLLERNVIEIAPLAYMRGRTLNDAYVILDEAQNTSVEQMKMFLTRIGYGSTAVITGDMSQIDLPKHQKSGLRDAMDVLRKVEGLSFTFFEAKDVVRHPLVAKIVRAYDARDASDDNADK